MPRDLPVGNGNLLVNFDTNHNIRNIYYPYVGKENHSEGWVLKQRYESADLPALTVKYQLTKLIRS